MERRATILGLAVLGMVILTLAPGVALAGYNCNCYFSTDCRTGEYCNWDSTCTRNCELQIDWKTSWGQPPVAKADCDSYVGPCHDNKPTPPVGTDGNGANCEPPTVANPEDPTKTINFKVMDGKCTKNPTPKPTGTAVGEINQHTEYLVNLANSGGGDVRLVGDPYVAGLMLSVAQLALGQYDLSSGYAGGDMPRMGDVRDATCGVEAIQVFGEAMAAEVNELGARLGRGEGLIDEPLVARSMLEQLSTECQSWVQRRPHDCQYPHPPEHAHVFPFADGLECIADQMGAMVRSLNLEVGPDGTPPADTDETQPVYETEPK